MRAPNSDRHRAPPRICSSQIVCTFRALARRVFAHSFRFNSLCVCLCDGNGKCEQKRTTAALKGIKSEAKRRRGTGQVMSTHRCCLCRLSLRSHYRIIVRIVQVVESRARAGLGSRQREKPKREGNLTRCVRSA